ncbi:MAG: hypothetical protein KAS66_03350 [Candidatus Omnitrophica bacterium]|nr:hypothetical protein [Candidatus Omnitrophota bacterium]
MTIKLEDIEALLDHELNKRKIDLKSTREEIKALETKLEEKKVHAEKLSFYVDKFSKVISIVEMDKKSKKPFEEVHPNIPPKLDRKPSTRDLP